MQENQAAILLLEDGTVFEGIAIGKIGTTAVKSLLTPE
jgi:carbamoylphosphate synthase small subunit